MRRPTAGQRALAIIPALNEAPRVGHVIERLRATTPWVDALVVDDGSTDETATVAAQSGASVLQLPFNLGIGGAVQAGFRFARARGYDLAVQVDADGQHDTRFIPVLFEPIQSGLADIAVGSRHLGADLAAVTPWRRTGQRITGRLVGWSTGESLTDGTSSFRAFGRRAIRIYAETYPEGFFETLEATAIAAQHRLIVREVSIEGAAREGGASSLGFRRALFFAAHATLALGLRAQRRSGTLEPGSEVG